MTECANSSKEIPKDHRGGRAGHLGMEAVGQLPQKHSTIAPCQEPATREDWALVVYKKSRQFSFRRIWLGLSAAVHPELIGTLSVSSHRLPTRT